MLPGMPPMRCKLCSETFPLKSNLAIAEERERLLAYLNPTRFAVLTMLAQTMPSR